MRRLAFILLFGFAFSMLVSATEYYTEMDGMNLDAIVKSDRLFKQYMNCILDEGPCTTDGRTLKHVLPDIVATACARCNPQQREMVKKIGSYIRNNEPQTWTAFLHKFDPNKRFATAYERFLES